MYHKNIKVIIVLIVALVFIGSSSLAFIELFQDPSFEDAYTYWTFSDYGGYQESSYPRTGSYDVQLKREVHRVLGVNLTFYGSVSQDITGLENGKTYEVSVYARQLQGTSIIIEGCEYSYGRGNSPVLLDPCENNYTEIAVRSVSEDDTDYVKVSGQFTKQDYDVTQIRFRLTSDNVQHWLYLDDSSLFLVESADWALPVAIVLIIGGILIFGLITKVYYNDD